MSKNLKLIKDLIHIQLKKSLSELKEVEADTDTEFKVSLKHLLKKHVVKGGEVEEAELEKEKFTEPDQMREAINVKSLKSRYEKAIKKEQALSSLMLMNLVKYKQAKASGNEKAIAKYTKIAGDLSPKKKDASEVANKAYQAYEDAISGLHADAELQIDEGLARGLKPLLMIGSTIKSTVGEDALLDLSDKFDEFDDEQADDVASHLNMAIELMQDSSASEARAWLKKFNKACKDALSGKSIKSAFENVNEVDMEDDTEFTVSLKHLTKKHVTKGGKIAEALYDDDGNGNYKYKKYVTKAFNNISDAIFEFRNAMGVKQLGQADPKIKKQLEALQVAIFSLRREFVSKGLTEAAQMGKGKLNEMDINDPILIAIRARQTMLKKAAGAPKVKKLSLDQYWKKLEYRSYIETQMKDAAKELEQLDSEMNQEAGQKGEDWSDVDANRYGGDLDKLQTKVEKLAKLKAKVNKSIMHYRTH
mgnify:CR=1 FL=1